MTKSIALDRAACNILWCTVSENEYQRADSTEDGQTWVFDTATGALLQVFPHGPECTKWCCEEIRFVDRAQILAEVGPDDLRVSREDLEERGFWLEEVVVPNPARYVEIPHIFHADQHNWLDEWSGRECGPHIGEALDGIEQSGGDRYAYDEFKGEKVRLRVIEWLEELARERDLSYEYDPTWIGP